MTLHLVRHAPPPPGVVADGDPVLYDRDGAWASPSGDPLSDEAVLDLLFRADRVVVW